MNEPEATAECVWCVAGGPCVTQHEKDLHAELAALRAEAKEVARGRHKFPGGPDHNYFTGFPGKNCPLCDLVEARRLRALKGAER